MNECEMQIQLRQPPPPIPSSLPTSSAAQQAVHHRSRLETELNLQKQRRADKQKLHHSQDSHGLLTPCASAGARPPVTAAAVQHLLDSFDHRIRQRTTAATTKCVNMSSEQARIAGIPGAPPPPAPSQHQQPSMAAASRHIASPPNPAAAAAFMLLKNRIIPSAQQNHHNGVDLSASSQKVATAESGGGPRRILSEQTSNRLRTSHSSNTNSNGGSSSSNNHIPLTTSPGNAANNNSHSSPSSASSGSSDCNSPPSSNGAGGGGGGGGNGPGLNGSAKIAGNGGRLQFFKDGKFILELASSREQDNGRPGWVAVPRKIYWPPTAQGFTTYNSPSASTTPTTMSSGPTSGTLPSTLGTNTNSNHSFQKNESSASLSFSDDNSSIQSSPWHREHCWKQLTPRRSISRGMCFVYVRPRKWIELSDRAHVVSLRKRRRPFDNGARMLTSNEAFQRREVVLKHAVELEEDGEKRVVKMETEEEASKCEETVQEKTDLGTEKVNGDSVNEKSAASVEGEVAGAAVHVKVEDGEMDDAYEDKSAEGSSDVPTESAAGVAEKMDEDAVDGTTKVMDDDKERKDNSNNDQTDSNKTVTGEEQVEKMDVKEEAKELEGPVGLHLKQQVAVKDTLDEREEAEKENIEKEQKEVKNKEMAGGMATTTPTTTGRRIRRKRQDLERIISTLLTSRKALLAKLKMSSPKLDALMHSHMHQHVSPRKRILREFERVTLDEASGGGSSTSSTATNSSAGKRHRARVHQNGNGAAIGKSGTSSSTFFVPSTGMLMGAPQSNGNGHSQHGGPGSGSSKLVNNGGGGSKDSSRSQALPPPSPASAAAQQSTASSKPISSYSIISLLGHNSSGGGGGGGGSNSNSHNHHSGSPRPEATPENLHPAHQQHNFASSQHQLHMESVAAAKGMDLLQYNKSLPPKKKLSPPPTSCPSSSSSSSTALASNWSSSPKATDPHHHLMMRSPEMSPSPEHGGRSAGGGAYKSATSSFHPYLNVSNRASPSDDIASLNGGSRYAHHHRSSPQQQFARDRHLSGSSPNSRYSPVHSSGNTNGKNPPAAHGAASPYSTSSRPSPMSATSPLSSHYFPALNAAGTGAAATGHSKANHHRSPSPAAGVSDRPGDRFLPQRRLIEEDRDRIGESELTALAIQQQQMEFERYAKFYGSAPHSMLGPGPPPPHLMMPGFEHMSEAAAAHLIRPPGNSSAALMNSLHQAAYLMYPPTGATSSGSAGGPGAPYLPPSSMPYYQQYMAAAAAAAMYGRGNPLWPYMAAGGIPGPPGSPMRMPPGLHHSPQMMQQSPILGMGREEGRSGFLERGGRMSPSSPLALRIGGERREVAVRESAMAMEQCRDDPDVPLNLSKH